MSAKSVVNDFSIQVATVNGSGSQTPNTVLLRAIFQMGVPLRRTATNMIYVGVLGELLGIPEEEVERALDAQLGRKPKALALNHAAVRAGWEWAKQNLEKRDPYRLERMDKTAGKILIDGN